MLQEIHTCLLYIVINLSLSILRYTQDDRSDLYDKFVEMMFLPNNSYCVKGLYYF